MVGVSYAGQPIVIESTAGLVDKRDGTSGEVLSLAIWRTSHIRSAEFQLKPRLCPRVTSKHASPGQQPASGKLSIILIKG